MITGYVQFVDHQKKNEHKLGIKEKILKGIFSIIKRIIMIAYYQSVVEKIACFKASNLKIPII